VSTLRTVISETSRRASSVTSPQCGVTITFGNLQSGLSFPGGSTAKLSRPAAAIRLDFSASTNRTIQYFEAVICERWIRRYIDAMARPRTFDPNDALLAARGLFWRKGYQGTSLDDITAETGLTKPSLYAAFGDKASLFLKVLDHYHDQLVARSANLLSSGSSARAAIDAWLMSLLPGCSGERGRRGCLSVNTSIDGSLDDAAIRKSIANFNARLERLILTRLEADRTQFSAEFDPVAATRTIMAIYMGLMAMAKQAPPPDHVKLVIGQVAKLLV
jgi:TetR/AcrR family transcriptional repressor of nem operon